MSTAEDRVVEMIKRGLNMRQDPTLTSSPPPQLRLVEAQLASPPPIKTPRSVTPSRQPSATSSRSHGTLLKKQTATSPSLQKPPPISNVAVAFDFATIMAQLQRERSDRMRVERLFLDREESHHREHVEFEFVHELTELKVLESLEYADLHRFAEQQEQLRELRSRYENSAQLTAYREELASAVAAAQAEREAVGRLHTELLARERDRCSTIERERLSWQQEKAALLQRVQAMECILKVKEPGNSAAAPPPPAANLSPHNEVVVGTSFQQAQHDQAVAQLRQTWQQDLIEWRSQREMWRQEKEELVKALDRVLRENSEVPRNQVQDCEVVTRPDEVVSNAVEMQRMDAMARELCATGGRCVPADNENNQASALFGSDGEDDATAVPSRKIRPKRRKQRQGRASSQHDSPLDQTPETAPSLAEPKSLSTISARTNAALSRAAAVLAKK